MKKILVLLAALVTLLGVLLTSPAQAHHAGGSMQVYTSNGSVSEYITVNNGLRDIRVPRGAATCCYTHLVTYVGPGHDVLITSREYPAFFQRMSATGWHALPRLGTSHLTMRSVLNGGG